MKATDSNVIVWLRFPLACLIVLLHAQFVEVEYRPVVLTSGFAYALKIFCMEGICRIAVPAFFLISGFLFFVNLEQWDKGIWLGKMKRRLHTLVIPYLLWNVLGIAYLCITPYVGAVTENPGTLLSVFQERGWIRMFWDSNRVMEQWNPPSINILGIAMHNGMPVNTPLWFIRDLIVINLFSPIIYVFVKKTKVYGLCALGILFLLNIWFPTEGFSVIGFLFYSIGAYFAIFSKGLVDSLRKVRVTSYLGAAVLLVLLVITFGRNEAAQYIQRFFQLFGVAAVFNVAADFMRKENGLFSRMADSSFFLYASHIFLISGVSFLLYKILPSSHQGMLALKYLLSAAVTITICELVYLPMKRICPGFLSFICGNRRSHVS